MMMFTIEGAFNSIWGFRGRVPCATISSTGNAHARAGPDRGASITSYLVVYPLGFAGRHLLRVPRSPAAPFVLTCAAFTLLYYVVPNRSSGRIMPHRSLVGRWRSRS